MDPRERLEAFLAGERPDQIPYTIYSNETWHTRDDPAWRPLFEAGLRVTTGATTCAVERKNLQTGSDSHEVDGQTVHRHFMRTPVGEIYTESVAGWTQKYLLETAEDYRVMRYIAENTELRPNYDAMIPAETYQAPYTIAHACVPGRSPIQTILVDYVGLEKFALHLYDLEEPMMELYEALRRNFLKCVEIVADGPGFYISVLENFTAETMGPERFARLHVPVYTEAFKMLHDAGKIVGTHFDGKLASCKELIAGAPIDLIESLTTPPEGDMTLAEARAAWPDKRLWCNINVSDYQLEPKQLKKVVLDAVEQGAPDGRRLAFEVSEHCPQNWKESIPVVMDALRETQG